MRTGSGRSYLRAMSTIEHNEDLPAIPGLPTARDMLRWCELIQPHVGTSHEVVGFRLVESGKVMAIVARKTSPPQ
ncbi:MAG TPA: hypothetical protein VFL55_11550 [Acetobacteraceae bacterium]|nr:hypothetical protein [Acetobacteraceae bacterium]